MGQDPAGMRHTNRLAGETSPYLLQHAHNPVDWYPWGPEAFARATELDRPVFLSIGYAACHWCHVMERESFEDEATAAALNGRFVAIKVDREERPDLDAIYMGAVQAMTGSGGWPMSVFLTPAGRPFYGGTYFPDTPRHGMPSFSQVLDGVWQAWMQDRGGLEAAATRLVEAVAQQQGSAVSGELLPPPSVLETAVEAIEASFDVANGGWGSAPKFPQPMTIEALLLRHATTGAELPLSMALRSLHAMAAGGIHDQLGGGFHRYATDSVWLVPHFEKMLYDNAQLARAYVHAWQVTGDRAMLDVVDDTLTYLCLELPIDEVGGFAASQDADTEGEEGATFVWSAAEIREVLGDEEGALFAAAYGVTDRGNWEGHTILSRVRTDAELGERFGLTSEQVSQRILLAGGRLLDRRRTRPQPKRDDKVLASWNGLAIAALADAYRSVVAVDRSHVEGDADAWLVAATNAATDVVNHLLDSNGRLRRSWKDGRANADGVLEDYANLAEGLLALYQATFDERWFVTARSLADTILERFSDPAGGFFDTPADGETLVVRPKGLQDNATPSGGAMATTVLLRLAALTGEARYRKGADRALAGVGPYLARYPTAFAQWLVALELAHAGIDEVAIVGDPASPEARRLLDVVDGTFRPFLVVAAAADPSSSEVPLLESRFAIDGRPTAFVCRDFACRQPVNEPEALAAQLVRG